MLFPILSAQIGFVLQLSGFDASSAIPLRSSLVKISDPLKGLFCFVHYPEFTPLAASSDLESVPEKPYPILHNPIATRVVVSSLLQHVKERFL